MPLLVIHVSVTGAFHSVAYTDSKHSWFFPFPCSTSSLSASLVHSPQIFHICPFLQLSYFSPPPLPLHAPILLAWVIFFHLFYWSRVDSQYCVNFCCTAKWLSYTHIPSFSYSFPLWFIIGYWIEFPVLYSRTLLFIHPIHTSLHLLIPNSHSIPSPPTSPLATTSLFFMSVCFCFVYRITCIIF